MNNEVQLIKNIKQDDYVSYNDLFIRYYSKLCLYVSEFTRSRSDAEDIVQELFIKLWTNRKKIEVQTNVSGYLYMTAKNMTLNFIKSEVSRKTAIDKLYKENEPYADPDENDGQYLVALENCIDQLPERCKEVLLLQRIQGYKQKEIAEKLNISVKTIKNQIWLSLQRLKTCLNSKK